MDWHLGDSVKVLCLAFSQQLTLIVVFSTIGIVSPYLKISLERVDRTYFT